MRLFTGYPWFYFSVHILLQHQDKIYRILFCLFACCFVRLENFSLIWRSHQYRWKAADFDLCSALMAIEQWGIFSLPYLMGHGTSVYNGHLAPRTRDTCTYCRAFSSGDVPTGIYDLDLSRLGFEHATFRMRGERTNRQRLFRGDIVLKIIPDMDFEQVIGKFTLKKLMKITKW